MPESIQAEHAFQALDEPCEQIKKKLQEAIRQALASEGFVSSIWPELEALLWEALEAFQHRPFLTAKKLSFTYSIRGGELFVDRKEKSITRSTVMIAFLKALEVQQAEGCVKGPKKLGCFGASYLYPIFLELGICKSKSEPDEKVI
jgi:hypothetical protein